jgi:hypothetical protein
MLIPENSSRLTVRRMLGIVAVWGLLGLFAWFG